MPAPCPQTEAWQKAGLVFGLPARVPVRAPILQGVPSGFLDGACVMGLKILGFGVNPGRDVG